MIRYLTLLLLTLAAQGCAMVDPVPRTSDYLPSLIDRHVDLEGRFGGPVKLADYVVVGDAQIYLTGNPDFGGRAVTYGSIVGVEGTLRYQRYSDSSAAEINPPVSRPPDHFYVDGAVVRVILTP